MPKKLSDFTTGQRVTDSEGNSRIYVSKSGSDKYVEHADLVSRDYHTGIQPLSTISDAGTLAGLDEAALSNVEAMPVSTIVGNSSTSTSAAPTALTATQVRTLLNVEDGATNNGETADLLARENHTGVMPVSAVEGLDTALADIETNSVTTKEITLDIGGTQLPVVLGADDSGETGYRILQVLNDGEPASPGVLNITSGNIDINEGGTHVFTVTRTGGTSGTTVARWTLSASGITTVSTGTLTWNDTESGTRSVTLTGADVASNQSGTITLTVDSGSSTLGTDDVTIIVRYVAAQTPGVVALVTNGWPVGQSGTTFTEYASRSSGSDGAIAVDWAVTPGSPGASTSPPSGTFTWAAADTANKSVTLTRGVVTSNQLGYITLSNPRRTDGGTPDPTLGAITSNGFGVQPSTNPGVITLVSTAIDVNELSTIPIVVSRTGGSYGTVTCRWTITGVGADTLTDVLTWTDGDTTNKTASPIADAVLTDDTNGVLTLSELSAGTFGTSTGTIAVRDVDSGSTYSIANAIAGLPFTVTAPATPTITLSDINITTSNVGDYTGINSSAANGRRLLFGAGAYSDITITGTNQEIVLTTGVTIRTLTTSTAAQYLKFTADPVRSGSIGYLRMDGQDITMDGITQSHVSLGGGAYDDTHNSFLVSRLAVINCSFYTRNYFVQAFCTSSRRLQNAIFGNNSFIQGPTSLNPSAASPFPAWRTQGALNVVVVDNLIRSDISHARHNFRAHAQADGSGLNAQYHYIARNQFEGEGNMITRAGDPPGTSPGTVNDIHFVDNEVYVSGSLILMDLHPSTATNRPNTITITGNAGYKTSASWPTAISGWTISDNTTAAYSSPPAWSFA